MQLHRPWPGACALLLCLVLAAASTPRVTAQETTPHSTDGTVIAYVSPSRENKQIRMIRPDGTDDRLVWSVPDATPRDDGIGKIAWRPDAAEIAFDSSHDGLRSMLTRDIYTVAPSGAPLRRLTRGPEPSSLASNPSGVVTVRIENFGQGRELAVYVEGASEAVRFTAAASTAYDVRFSNVADLGPGVRQYVRLLSLTSETLSQSCWFDDAVFADVEPGQTVSAGRLGTVRAFICPFAFAPSWRADGGAAAFVLREATTALAPPNNIWQASVTPAPLTYGDRLLDMNQFVTTDRLFDVAYGPPARSDEMLIIQNGATDTPVLRGPASDLAQATRVSFGLCPRTSCAVLGVAWLPDGSGFVFSRVEAGSSLGNPPPAGGAIYEYTFAGGRLRELLRLPGEAIGRLTVSPDGQTLAFERAARLDDSVARVTRGPRLLCPCDLYLAGRNGSNLRLLVRDARAPAWSLVAPSVVPGPPQPAPDPALVPRFFVPLVGG